MAALPIHIATPSTPESGGTHVPPAPRGVGFIPLVEAERRSGLAQSTLAERCRNEWAAAGLAKVESPADRGKPCWHVREDADGRFARCKSPEVLPVDWLKLTERQRATIRRRKRILDEWTATRAELLGKGYTADAATEEFLKGLAVDGEEAVSVETLRRWRRSYQAAGMAGLVDGRLDRDGKRDGEEFIAELKRLYLDARQRGASLCYDMACDKAADAGWIIPFGPRRARQVIAAIDPKIAAYHRLGARDYAGHFGKYIQRDYSEMASNEMWVSDGFEFNVMVEHEGKIIRPMVVSWMDTRSGFITGHYVTPGSENSDVILAAFSVGAKGYGLPDWVYHDNGKGYDAKSLQGQTKRQRRAGMRPVLDLGVFERLEVHVKHAIPYNAKAKLNERWHRTIDERFCRRFATYTGRNTARKPYDLQVNLKADKAPTFDEFKQAFADWLEADYHNRVHEGERMDGKTPAQVYAENLKTKRVADADVLDLELCKRVLVKVGRNGITVGGVTYESRELDCRTGQEVYAMIDPDNVARVKVLDAEKSFVGVADSIRRMPANTKGEELREAMAAVKRDQKRARIGKEAGMRVLDDPVDRLRRKAEKAARTAPTPEPATIKLFRPKLEGEMPAIRAAEKADDRRPADEAPDYSRMSLAELMGRKAANG